MNDMERMRGALETVTGSAAAAGLAFRRMQEFAATTPFALEQSINAFIRLKALGLDPTEARLLSFGNTAAAFGAELTDVIEAVADASTFEFERLKAFGIKARQQGDQVAFTFQGVTTVVQKNSRDVVRYLEEIGRVNFAGAMEQQLDRLPGQVSNLGDNFSRLLLLLADRGPTEAAVDGLKNVNSVLDDINEIIQASDESSKGWFDTLIKRTHELIEENIPLLNRFFGVVGNMILAVVEPTVAVVKNARDALKELGDEARAHNKAITADLERLAEHAERLRGADVPGVPSNRGSEDEDPFGSKKKKLTVGQDLDQAFNAGSDRSVVAAKNRNLILQKINKEHLARLLADDTAFQELKRGLTTKGAKDALTSLKNDYDERMEADLEARERGVEALEAQLEDRRDQLGEAAELELEAFKNDLLEKGLANSEAATAAIDTLTAQHAAAKALRAKAANEEVGELRDTLAQTDQLSEAAKTAQITSLTERLEAEDTLLTEAHADELAALKDKLVEQLGLETGYVEDVLALKERELRARKEKRDKDKAEALQDFYDVTASLAQLSKSRNKVLSGIGKAAALASVAVSAAVAIGHHIEQSAKYPYPLNLGIFAALTAGTIAQKVQQISAIQSASLERGGLIGGNPSLGDAYAAMMHAGEVAVPRKNFDELKEGIERNALARSGDGGGEARQEVEVVLDIRLNDDASELITAQEGARSAVGT